MNKTDLVPKDWCFIDKDWHQCPGDEKLHLLEYEYAREAADCKLQYRSALMWTQIFGDRFPQTPFLAINPVERQRLLKKAFLEEAGGLRLFDYTRANQVLPYQFSYTLKQDYQDGLEAVAEEAREKLNLVQPQRDFEMVVTQFKQGLPDAACDESVAEVRMTLRFDYSDKKLIEAFTDMLTAIRRTKPKSSKQVDLDVWLKRLAAARLYRLFGSVKKAESFVLGQGFDQPYEGHGGWTRARQEVRRMLRLNVFPQAKR